jgi:ribose 5-phosphate isomerase A
MTSDQEKEAAARASLEFVGDGDVVGLGTGSTAALAVRFLGERVRAGLSIRGVPTSKRTMELAASVGIPLTTLDVVPAVDVTIDGADEVDPELRLVKGGGGALLYEKIVASASRRVVIIADSSKQVSALGRFPLPVEVVPFGHNQVAAKVAALGANVRLRVTGNGEPYLTDERHYILDCNFGKIGDPGALARELDGIPGVVEHGLFIGLADFALIGKGSTVTRLRPPGSSAA